MVTAPTTWPGRFTGAASRGWLSEGRRRTGSEKVKRDRAPWALRTALRELLVRLEVYRPYTPGDTASVVTEVAAAEARAARGRGLLP